MKRSARIIAFAAFVVVALVVLAAVIVPGGIVPQLERRLAEETGLTWRIGAAHLSPDLALDLSDVSARDPAERSGAPLFTAKSLALSGPPKLAFGGGGSVKITASGISTRSGGATFSGKPPTGAAARLSDATIFVRGLRVQTTDDLKSGSATADKIDATLQLEEGPARARHIAATLDAADAVTRIDLRETNAATPILSNATTTVVYDPRAGGSKIAFDSVVRLVNEQARFDDIRGTVDGGAFTGTAAADYSARPSLEWNLAFDRFALIDDLDTPAPKTIADGVPSVRASALKDVDLAWLDRLQVNGSTRVADARIGNARAGSVASLTTVREGVLDVAVTAARFYDGAARARYVLTRTQGGGAHQMGLSIQKARALPFLSDMVGVRGLDGTTNLRFDAQARGDRLDDAIKTMSGFGDLSVLDGAINGLDLANTAGLGTGGLPGGLGTSAAGLLNTKFSRLTSTFRIDNGRATTTDLHFETPVIDTTGTGTVDLSTKTIDFTLRPALAGKKTRIDVPVRVSGPWASPSVSTDFSGVLANPGAALQSLQDLGGALGKGGGGGLGGLGGLLDGIMPKGAPRRR